MTQQSMTEAELKEFLTALSDNCGNKKKMEWYHGLIEDIGIAFTEHTPDAGEMLEEAKNLWQKGNKLEAVKLMCQSGYRLKDAKNYCDENFGLLPHLPNSTENLSKIKNKDEWLNEVRGNEGKPISEDELYQQFQDQFILANADYWSEPAENCIQIVKQYSDSKLSELEKWVDENKLVTNELDNVIDFLDIKTKIQSLK